MKIKEEWHPSIDYWTEISEQTAKFWLDQSEKRMNGTVLTFYNNKQRAYTLMAIILPLIVAGSGYILQVSNSKVLLPATVFVFVELVGISFVIKGLYSKAIYSQGFKPSDFVCNDMILPNKPATEQFNAQILAYIGHLEHMIVYNESQGNEIAKYVNRAITICGLVGPAIFFISAALLAFYH